MSLIGAISSMAVARRIVPCLCSVPCSSTKPTGSSNSNSVCRFIVAYLSKIVHGRPGTAGGWLLRRQAARGDLFLRKKIEEADPAPGPPGQPGGPVLVAGNRLRLDAHHAFEDDGNLFKHDVAGSGVKF